MINYKYCKNCKNKSFSQSEGIICNLTGSKPAFSNTCENYDPVKTDKDVTNATSASKFDLIDSLKKKYRSFLFFIITGTILALISVLMTYRTDEYIIVSTLGGLSILIGSIVSLTFMHKVWVYIINESDKHGFSTGVRSAGQAIGFLFIPFFNFYWLFIGIGKLPENINRLATLRKGDSRTSEGLAIVICIFAIFSVIPVVGVVLGLVNGLILLPVFYNSFIKSIQQIPEYQADIHGGANLVDTVNKDFDLDSVRDYSELFNREKLGFNYQLPLFIVIAGLLINPINYVLQAGIGNITYILPYLKNFLYEIPISCFRVFGIVILSYFIRNKLLLSASMGVLAVFSSFIYLLLYHLFNSAVIDAMTNSMKLTNYFVWFFRGSLYILSIVLAIRFFGVKFWSFLITSLVFYLVVEVATIFVWENSFNLQAIIRLLANTLFTAIAVYFGFKTNIRALHNTKIDLSTLDSNL